jgi:hypothetical protein
MNKKKEIYPRELEAREYRCDAKDNFINFVLDTKQKKYKVTLHTVENKEEEDSFRKMAPKNVIFIVR